MKFIISKELLEKVLSYLAKKPFHEVANIMKELGTLKEFKKAEEIKK